MSLTIPVTIDGRYFIRDGKRFNIRGIVYQPCRMAGSIARDEDYDPLRDECLDDLHKDIKLFIELGINAIKVYTILPSLSHDAAFEALASSGIYVLVGLSNRHQCINRLRPHESYTTELVNHYLRTVDCVSKYNNVLGMVAANSVIDNAATTVAAEVIRAVIRDIKSHTRQQNQLKGQRILPVGIADGVYPSTSTHSIDYFTAGDKQEQIDFYSFVKYDRVIEASSHWDQVTQRFAQRNTPILVSEYGDNSHRPRQFHEVTSLFSPKVTRVLSGGFVYDFIEGPNKYGLVMDNGQKLVDFNNLRQKFQETATIEEYPTSELEEYTTTLQVDYPSVSEIWRASPDTPGSVLPSL